MPSGQLLGHFLHGVASGDPLSAAIVLWTRLTPVAQTNHSIAVRWFVWEEVSAESTATIFLEGEAAAHPDRDFTVKVDARSQRFRSSTQYAYRFECGPARSPQGGFTLPPARGHPLASLTYAIFSCANIGWGSFAAYAAAVARGPLDFWLHLGDYYYEYGPDHYPGPGETIKPGLQPKHEIITLEDYRQRHAMYRLDSNLQRLSASSPMIAIWDDHDVANDAWMHGARNHQPKTEGNFDIRKRNAVRAYHEWLPTRPEFDAFTESSSAKMPWMRWRRFDFGDLATLLMLETRLVARTTQQAVTKSYVRTNITDVLAGNFAAPPTQWPGGELETEFQKIRHWVEAHRRQDSKRMLGDEQLLWIREQSSEPRSTEASQWLLVGQPQVVQELMSPDYFKAVELARKAGQTELASVWSAILRNLTRRGKLYTPYSPSPPPSFVVSPQEKVTTEVRNSFMVELAAGMFGIQLNFDSWTGYVAERNRLAETLLAARRAAPKRGIVLYGGDSHNAWAGTLRTSSGQPVAADFDGMSVSSPGLEREHRWVPPALEAAAWRAANPDLAWADTSQRGLMLVHLERQVQHLEFIAVDTLSLGEPVSAAGRCLAAFELTPNESGMPRQGTCRRRRPEPRPSLQPEAHGPTLPGEQRPALLIPRRPHQGDIQMSALFLAGLLASACLLGGSLAVLGLRALPGAIPRLQGRQYQHCHEETEPQRLGHPATAA